MKWNTDQINTMKQIVDLCSLQKIGLIDIQTYFDILDSEDWRENESISEIAQLIAENQLETISDRSENKYVVGLVKSNYTSVIKGLKK